MKKIILSKELCIPFLFSLSPPLIISLFQYLRCLFNYYVKFYYTINFNIYFVKKIL